MYESETYEVILNRMLNRIPESLDKRPSAVIYDTHSPTAIELQNLYIELEYMIQNSYGDTASREFLILLAKDRGLEPKEATYAILLGEFTPGNIDVTGKRFSIEDVNYTVLEYVSGNDDASYYLVQCETPGTIGNQYLGTLVPIEYVDGLETAKLIEVSIPGEDEEDTEDFRQRYFDSFDATTYGGNRADYIAKVTSISGVGDCKVTRVWNSDLRPADMIPSDAVTRWYNSVIGGLDEEVALWLTTVYTAALEKKLTVGGTVLITIVDSDDYGEASSTLIDTVQTTLDPEVNAGEGYGLAPIGHVVYVKSAEGIPVNVTIDITFAEGYSWSNLQSTIEDAVEAYLLELRKEWADSTYTIVRIAQVETRILGVTGVVDVANCKINGSEENLTLGEYEIPVLGGVSA